MSFALPIEGTRPTMVSSAVVYADALRGEPVDVVAADGSRQPLAAERWVGSARGSDLALLDRLRGPVLDLGCGPGRFVAALARRGVAALGVDQCRQAVRLTTAAGGCALQRCLFNPLPGEGRWESVLLVDGNIGIGGDPVALLRRAAELVRPGGRVLVELSGTGVATMAVRLESPERIGEWFPWSTVGPDAVAGVARAAGLQLDDLWSDPADQRCFALLRRVCIGSVQR